MIAVLTYRYTDNPNNIPLDWPAQVQETDVSPGPNWVMMTTNEYNAYIDTNKPAYDVWYNSVYLITKNAIENLTNIIVSTKLSNADSTTTEKAIKVAPITPEGSSSTLVSHNFCDPTTWWTQSIRISQETLSTSDNFTFNSGHVNWIDITHGKIPYEDRLQTATILYKPVIYIDNVVTTTGFTINYATGDVTFESSQTGKTVKADYNYATGSMWKIEPTAGKIIKLIGTEVKFTKDITWGNHSIIFAPFSGNTQVGAATVYKSIFDLIKCTTGNYQIVPSFGGNANDVVIMPFNYTTSKDLKSSQGLHIRIWLSDDQPVQGGFGVVKADIISLTEIV